jgi:hypothetical protein
MKEAQRAAAKRNNPMSASTRAELRLHGTLSQRITWSLDSGVSRVGIIRYSKIVPLQKIQEGMEKEVLKYFFCKLFIFDPTLSFF